MKKEGKRRLFAATACAAALAVAAVTGTLAYLTDTDSDVNVMTLGNVKIAQHEYERVVNADGSYKTATIDEKTSYVLTDFTQAKPLYPIVGDPSLPGDDPEYAGYDTTTVRMSQVDSYGGMEVFAGKNAQDKFVTVENTGKSDAYVRTLVAIEIGSADSKLVGSSYHKTWAKNNIGTIVIDGNNYYLIEFVYAGAQLSDGSWRHEGGILPAGETSYPNLSQVYLKHTATNEDMEAIDGNGNGTLDILVLSQAVQTEGFENAQAALDTAFGDASEKAVEWFGGTKVPTIAQVSTLAEMQKAINDGATIIDAQGANLGDFDYSAVFVDGTIVKNAKFTYFYGGNVKGTVTFDNCEFVSDHSYSANFDSGKGNIVFNNCLFDGWSSFGTAITGVEFNNCTFQKSYNYGILRFYQDAQLNNCTFADGFEGVDTNMDGTVVSFNGCTGIEGKIFNNGSKIGTWIVDGVDISSTVTSW